MLTFSRKSQEYLALQVIIVIVLLSFSSIKDNYYLDFSKVVSDYDS